MKTLKPLGLGLLTRVFEDNQQPYLVVTVLVFFPFQSPRRLLGEVSLWKFVAAELGKDAAIDASLPKIRGELLVHGAAYPPGGKKPACSVRVTLGAIDKELWAVGDRRWETNGSTQPEPFERMPITWENAFGGPDYPQNPLGKGAAPTGKVHPLPNIEDPKKLLRTPRDRPLPAGFGAYDETWPQRHAKVGTYDQRWLEKRFPGFAEDFDPSYFSVAPDDQQLQGFFRGDEAFVLENMHPVHRRLEGHLPGVITRAFITRKDGDGELVEQPMRLDTVRLFPHAERGILSYRAVFPVEEDDAADVADLMIAADPLGELRPQSHFADVRRKRLDKNRGALHALRDKDLMPPRPEGPKVPEDDWNDTAKLMEMEHAQLAGTRRYLTAKMADVKAEIDATGLPPAEPVPTELPPERAIPDLDELPEYMDALDAEIAEVEADAKARDEATEKLAREQCAEQGLDYDAIVKNAAQGKGGPPEFSADRELEKMRDLAELARNAGIPPGEMDARLADPELEASLREAEKRIFWAYRRFTHHMPAAAYRGEEASAGVRAEVRAAHERGESLAGRDLTGADLHDLDLSGADLGEALLEAANLAGANLRKAKLRGATLARADLRGAVLEGAELIDANLGLGRLGGAKLAGANLGDANLSKADLAGADFTGAQLVKARLEEAVFRDTTLAGVNLSGTTLMKTDLTGIVLRGASLREATLHEVVLDRADLTGADLTSATLIGVRAAGAVIAGAHAGNLRCVMTCALPELDARGADLAGANLRGADLTGADLSGAKLPGADLSECKMAGAKLYRIEANGARFSKTDLTGADLRSATLMTSIFDRAKLYGADLRGANLFRSDLAKIRGDKETNLKDANVKQVRVVAAPPAKPKEAPRGSR